MKILLAGGSGFIGRAIEKYFSTKGHSVSVLSRSPQRSTDVYWDSKTIGDWTSTLKDSDVLINLTGKSVDCRYTPSNKKEILRSRIDSTAVLHEALAQENHSVKLFVNASSATIYEHSLHRPNTETNGVVGSDFSMDVVRAWEKTFFDTPTSNMRKVALRMSIVLGTEGGAYPTMRQITRLGLGGHQGSGKQMVSWIHIGDTVRAIEHIIHHKELEGPINVTSPTPVSNSQFMATVRAACGQTFGLSQPKWILESGAFFLRTETELLLKSRYVLPDKLLSSGFSFTYDNIHSCLQTIENKRIK